MMSYETLAKIVACLPVVGCVLYVVLRLSEVVS